MGEWHRWRACEPGDGTRTCCFRFPPQVRADLEALTKAYGDTPANIVRHLIHNKANQLRLADALPDLGLGLHAVDKPPKPKRVRVRQPPKPKRVQMTPEEEQAAADAFFVPVDLFDPEILAQDAVNRAIAEERKARRKVEQRARYNATARAKARAAKGLPPVVTALPPAPEAPRCPVCRTLVPLDQRHICIGCPRCRKPLVVGQPHTCTGFVFP